MALRLADVTSLLDSMYDPRWAEPWDAVGLVCGDPDQGVARILFAVDPAPVVVEEAVEWHADLVVVHHPLLLKGVHGVGADTAKGRVVHRLLRDGTALFTAHTNADSPPKGVNEALARALGLEDPEVLVAEDEPGLDKLVTFVPVADAERVRTAITSAGAGRIGDYDSCTFTSVGEGRFRPLEDANPVVGRVGELAVVPEARVESVFPRERRRQVVEAMLHAHPYEEPAYDVVELAVAPPALRTTRGQGRIGTLASPVSLREFAASASAALRPTSHGVRVAGDPDRQVQRVAVASGSGDFLLDTVLETDADVYVTSDLRHHRAGEFLEQAGPALVDVAHWAAEWTWLPVVEQALTDAVTERGTTVETRVSTTVTDPWTFRVDR